MKGNAANDKLEGKQVIFDGATGIKKNEFYCINDELSGPYAAFDSISGAKMESGYYSNSEKDGEWLFYYKDTNKVRSAIYYRSGYLNGYCAAYHFSGNKKFEVLFQGGQPVGKWSFYYDKPEVLSSVLTFEDGLPVDDMRSFDSATGKLIMVGHFVNGKRSGKWTYYYPESGKVAKYEIYKEGMLNGDMESFYPSGKNKSWNTYKFGVQYDSQIEYFEDGSTKQMVKCTGTTGYAVVTNYDSVTKKPLVKGEFQRGKKTGQWYVFYPGTDVVHYNEQYKKGMNDGDIKYYYPDGSKQVIGRFNDGKKVGKWNYYYANSGKDWMKMEFDNDRRYGDLYVYYENGDLKRHEVIRNDTLVSHKCLSEDGKEMSYTPLYVDAKFDGNDVSTFIGNELKYPVTALVAGTEGKVSVQFVVNEDGSISDPDVTQSLSEECDKEALRVVSAMPKWKPATIDGVPFKSIRSVPVVFWLR